MDLRGSHAHPASPMGMCCPPAPQSFSPSPRSQEDSIQQVKCFQRRTNPCRWTTDKVLIGNKCQSKATVFIFQADPVAMRCYDNVIPVLDLIPLSIGNHCGCRSIRTGFALPCTSWSMTALRTNCAVPGCCHASKHPQPKNVRSSRGVTIHLIWMCSACPESCLK